MVIYWLLQSSAAIDTILGCRCTTVTSSLPATMSAKHRSVLEFVSDQWDKLTGKYVFSNVFINLSIPLLIGRNQPPWDENWVLDEKFFRQMEAWETENPESTFAKVIEKVNRAVTMCQPSLVHIPDSPFPARSLIQGLAYLLQLGTVRAVLILVIDCIIYKSVCRQSQLQRKTYTILQCRSHLGSLRLRRLCVRERRGNLPARPKRI